MHLITTTITRLRTMTVKMYPKCSNTNVGLCVIVHFKMPNRILSLSGDWLIYFCLYAWKCCNLYCFSSISFLHFRSHGPFSRTYFPIFVFWIFHLCSLILSLCLAVSALYTEVDTCNQLHRYRTFLKNWQRFAKISDWNTYTDPILRWHSIQLIFFSCD